jgi:methylenetetrahydrofolate--tRNA-(uracil-5-)-methyltransferase
VVQLRPEDFSNKMYNLVGFQTSLRQGAQREVIKMIPGLENAEILRYGVVHRNTYFNSPKILNNGFNFKKYPNLYLAGQISGVEGYVESAASGIAAAISLYNKIINGENLFLPDVTITGSLSKYVSTPNSNFVPMNANFGIVPSLEEKVRKKERREAYAKRALDSLEKFKKENECI